jgi:hypothetical protein
MPGKRSTRKSEVVLHISGLATHRALTHSPCGSAGFPTQLNLPAKLFGKLPKLAFFCVDLANTVSRGTFARGIYTLRDICKSGGQHTVFLYSRFDRLESAR